MTEAHRDVIIDIGGDSATFVAQALAAEQALQRVNNQYNTLASRIQQVNSLQNQGILNRALREIDLIERRLQSLERTSRVVNVSVESRGLEQLQEKIEDLDRGTPVNVSVESQGLEQLQARLEDLNRETPSVNVPVESQGLEQLQARLEALDRETPSINVSVESQGLEQLQARLENLDRGTPINVSVESQGLEQLQARLEDLDRETATISLAVSDNALTQLEDRLERIRHTTGTVFIRSVVFSEAFENAEQRINQLENRTINIRVDVEELNNAIQQISLDQLADATLTLRGQIDDSFIQAEQRLNSVQDRTVTITAIFNEQEIERISNALGQAVDRINERVGQIEAPSINVQTQGDQETVNALGRVGDALERVVGGQQDLNDARREGASIDDIDVALERYEEATLKSRELHDILSQTNTEIETTNNLFRRLRQSGGIGDLISDEDRDALRDLIQNSGRDLSLLDRQIQQLFSQAQRLREVNLSPEPPAEDAVRRFQDFTVQQRDLLDVLRENEIELDRTFNALNRLSQPLTRFQDLDPIDQRAISSLQALRNISLEKLVEEVGALRQQAQALGDISTGLGPFSRFGPSSQDIQNLQLYTARQRGLQEFLEDQNIELERTHLALQRLSQPGTQLLDLNRQDIEAIGRLTQLRDLDLTQATNQIRELFETSAQLGRIDAVPALPTQAEIDRLRQYNLSQREFGDLLEQNRIEVERTRDALIQLDDPFTRISDLDPIDQEAIRRLRQAGLSLEQISEQADTFYRRSILAGQLRPDTFSRLAPSSSDLQNFQIFIRQQESLSTFLDAQNIELQRTKRALDEIAQTGRLDSLLEVDQESVNRLLALRDLDLGEASRQIDDLYNRAVRLGRIQAVPEPPTPEDIDAFQDYALRQRDLADILRDNSIEIDRIHRSFERLRDPLTRLQDLDPIDQDAIARLRQAGFTLEEMDRQVTDLYDRTRRLNFSFAAIPRTLSRIGDLNRHLLNVATALGAILAVTGLVHAALAALPTVLGAAGAALAVLAVIAAGRYTRAIRDAQEQTALAADQVDRLQAATGQLGLTVQETADIYAQAEGVFANLRFTLPTAEEFEPIRQLGIDIAEIQRQGIPAEETLVRISDAIQGLSIPEGRNILEQIFGDNQQLIQLVLSGRLASALNNVSPFRADVSPEDFTQIDRVRERLERLTNTAQSFLNEFVAQTGEGLLRVLDLVEQRIPALAQSITDFFLPRIDDIGQRFNAIWERGEQFLRDAEPTVDRLVQRLRQFGGAFSSLGLSGPQVVDAAAILIAGSLVTRLLSAVAKLGSTITQFFPALVRAFNSLGRIVPALTQAFNLIRGLGAAGGAAGLLGAIGLTPAGAAGIAGASALGLIFGPEIVRRIGYFLDDLEGANDLQAELNIKTERLAEVQDRINANITHFHFFDRRRRDELEAQIVLLRQQIAEEERLAQLRQDQADQAAALVRQRANVEREIRQVEAALESERGQAIRTALEARSRLTDLEREAREEVEAALELQERYQRTQRSLRPFFENLESAPQGFNQLDQLRDFLQEYENFDINFDVTVNSAQLDTIRREIDQLVADARALQGSTITDSQLQSLVNLLVQAQTNPQLGQQYAAQIQALRALLGESGQAVIDEAQRIAQRVASLSEAEVSAILQGKEQTALALRDKREVYEQAFGLPLEQIAEKYQEFLDILANPPQFDSLEDYEAFILNFQQRFGELARLGDALSEPVELTADQIARADALIERVTERWVSQQDTMRRWAEFALNSLQQFNQSVAEAIVGTQSLEDVFRNFFENIGQSLVTNVLNQLTTGLQRQLQDIIEQTEAGYNRRTSSSQGELNLLRRILTQAAQEGLSQEVEQRLRSGSPRANTGPVVRNTFFVNGRNVDEAILSAVEQSQAAWTRTPYGRALIASQGAGE